MKAQIFTRHFVGGIAGFDVRPAHPIGGAEVYVADLARILHNAGFDVEVLAGGDDAGTADLGYCRVRVFPLPRRWAAATFPLILARRFAAAEEPEALRIYSETRYAALRPTGSSARTVGILHGVEWDTTFVPYVLREVRYRARSLRGLPGAALKYAYFSGVVPWLTRRGLRRVAAAVSVDRHTLAYLPAALVSRVTVIPNYVDVDAFTPEVPPYQDGPDRSKHVILVPRNLNVARGVHLIPPVARLLRERRSDFVFWILGTGPLRAYLEHEVARHRLDEHVRLMGHVGRDVLPGYYTRSTAVLIPSVFSEATSLSALEGMAAGRTVVMTEVGGLRELGQDGATKIAVHPSPRDIAEKVHMVLEDAALRRRIGESAAAYARAHHSRELWERRWREIIARHG
ncbi:MAG: hypothetical protein A2V59_08945 [Armatimonadetes bacterium RBG_19FT_COMBO_69_19]|nr:MAG: hypothetical protein A2V59_08945 [Armatimonadetes bacterium RBG_19FT_COMBO_69_19]